MTVRVIQVTNVSTQCQKEQIKSLFAHVGRIDEIHLYPDSETLSASVGAKVAYIKYERSELAQAALQLTNTIFIDRPLICTVVKNGKIPDETEAMKYCAPLTPNISLIPGGATWPNTIINRVVGTGPTSIIETIDPNLAERSISSYPPLPGTIDPLKAEEIRRTVYVYNISSNVSLENINDLFSQVGEIRFIRFAGDETSLIKGAYIEFSEQPHIVKALCLNGLLFAGKHLKVNHATCSIVKPATNKQIYALKEKSPKHSSVRSRKSKSPTSYKSSKKRSRSPHHRSSSHKRSHSKKRSKSPHKHSTSSKKRSRDREKRRRSSSRSKKRSRSREKKRSRSKEVKKRRSASKGEELLALTKSHHRATSNSSHMPIKNKSKSYHSRSRSRDKKDLNKVKKVKSKESSNNSPKKYKSSSRDKQNSENDERAFKRDYDEEEKSLEISDSSTSNTNVSANGDLRINSPRAKQLKSPYGPNPPPNSSNKKNQSNAKNKRKEKFIGNNEDSTSTSGTSSSENNSSSSSSEDEGVDDEENHRAMEPH